jgi:hypothetical protein
MRLYTINSIKERNDLGMKQVLLAQNITKHIFTPIENSYLDFFSSNWVVFASSDRKFLPRMDNGQNLTRKIPLIIFY